MRRAVCVVMGLVAGGLAHAAQAEAPQDSVAAFYDSTLVVENVEGWRIKRYLHPDNTFTQTGSGGPARGRWEVADGRLCTTQLEPSPPSNHPRTFCNTGPGYKPGDRWRDKDPLTGNLIYFKLHPGR
jgi:hypothetical protein